MSFISLWLNNLNGSIYALLLFIISCICVFYLFPKRSRVFILLLESLLFYSLVDLRFLALVVAQTLFSWAIGRYLGRELSKEKEVKEKAIKGSADIILWFGIIVIVIVLCFFKYFNFFAERMDLSLKVIMPLGISYYSFRQISYLVDIRKNKIDGNCSIINYASYVLFFPQMVSGPIARFKQIEDSFNKGIEFDNKLFGDGIKLVISGLFKKLVLADRMSAYVELIFGSYKFYPSISLWIAAVLYSLQLYLDFAGYSEIAIGTTKMFGLDCDMNFNRPYFALDMKDFWHRWHISLSTWLRDYIYFPLGGSRVSKLRSKLNVFAVFFICGLWHGSGLRYPVWGIYHGFWNVTSGVFSKKKDIAENKINPVIRSLRQILVFVIALFGWILFRANTFADAALYVVHMFDSISINYQTITASILPFTSDSTCVAYVLTLFIMLVFMFVVEYDNEYHVGRYNKLESFRIFLYVLFIIMFGVTGSGSFLYANY
ncbi:MBOAT family O-acyltransferase [Butyrivibrio sp. NC3005]|uniref:MBOAT family O-acyltransferase n=1 Tax=Butyrivibrio sp. NC3005 TaxID=1280685 RepID=UPI000408BABD|nr:MBOAT family O-acyltransferase [Butyrivibrio sp. NC3005]